MIKLIKATIFCLVLISVPLTSTGEGGTSGNVVKDIWLHHSPQWANLVVAFQRTPSWSLSSTRNNRARLLISDVKLTQRAEARIIKDNSGVLSASVQQGENFLCDLKFRKPFRQVAYSRSRKTGFLIWRFFWPAANQKVRSYTVKSVRMKNVRYGKRAKCDRMVMEFSGKPAWSMKKTSPKYIALRINNCKWTGKVRLAKMRLIKAIGVKTSGSDVVVWISTLVAAENFRVFWLEVGNRLVVDFMLPEMPELARTDNLPKDFAQELIESSPRKPINHIAPVDKRKDKGRTAFKPFKPFEVNVVEKLQEPRSNPAPKVIKKIPKPDPVQGGRSSSSPTTFEGNAKAPEFMSKNEAMDYGRILAAMNFKEYETGVELIDRFLRKYPQSKACERLLFVKGDFYLRMMALGDSSRLYATINSFKTAIQKYPNSSTVPKAYLKMAKASRMAGDFYGAMGYLNLLFDKYKGQEIQSAGLLERAMVYEKLQLVDKAFQDYNTIVRLFPHRREAANARFGIARYLHNKGLYEETEKWLKEIESQDPGFGVKNPEFYMLRAKNDLYLKRFTRARKQFLIALNLGESVEPVESVITRIGDTYLYEGDKKAAKKLYTFVVTHFPDSEAVSIAQLRLADLTAGIKKFKKLHDRYGDSPLGELALLKLANVYFKSKAYDKVIGALREMALKPVKDEAGKAAITLFYQACEEAITQAYEEKRFEDCISLYEQNKLLVEDKIGASTRLRLAEAFFKTGSPKQALEILGPYEPGSLPAKVRPRYALVYAKALVEAGKVNDAIEILEKERAKITNIRQKASYSLFLGNAYQKVSMPSKALISYKGAVKNEKALDPSQRVEAWLEIGRIQNSLGNIAEARAALKRCLQLVGKKKQYQRLRVTALLNLAETYGTENDPRVAARILESVLEQGYGPNDEQYWEIKFSLGSYYERMGEIKKAEAIYKEVGDEGPPILQTKAQIRLGSILLRERLKELPHWSEVAGR